jgi:ribosomal protein S18 acetylase RimI-like enzyme
MDVGGVAMENVIIEKAAVGDFQRLNDLYGLLGCYPSEFSLMKETFNEFIKNDDYYLLVMRLGDYVIATGLGVVVKSLANGCRPYFVIDNVAVDEHYQQQGYGTKLFCYFEEIARSRNCCMMYLVAESENYDAHNLYRNLQYNDKVIGFQKTLIY